MSSKINIKTLSSYFYRQTKFVQMKCLLSASHHIKDITPTDITIKKSLR